MPPANKPLIVLVHHRLSSKRLTLAVAESCTGGLLSGLLTSIPGSSVYFTGAIVAYSNEAKSRLLGVSLRIIREQGAVSLAVARAMACGARKTFSSAIGIGVTGIAGPGGGTRPKPVGTVCIAVSDAQGTIGKQFRFKGDRASVRHQSCMEALRMLASRLSITA